MNITDIRSLTRPELERFIADLGEPPYRAAQLFEWLHNKMAGSFGEMTNLPQKLRETLNERARIAPVSAVERRESSDGAVKYLFELDGGDVIESVLMPYRSGDTLCLSSQAGCRMGCLFCASAKGGLSRGLTAGEIVGQVYAARRDSGRRVSNVVVMGTGEPFDNYANVMDALRLLNDARGQGIGQRAMTVSTCGVTEGIYAFADENTQINLAVSLHAPNDAIRAKLMPISKRISMEALLKACAYYQAKTNRRVTYEYALAAGINDAPEHARELGEKLKGTLSHVNLMLLNGIGAGAAGLAPARPESLASFAAVLKTFGIEATARRGRGADINAACGQLRSQRGQRVSE